MIKNKTILLVSSALFLSSCSMGSIFGGDKEQAPLEGDRVSVLELQRGLNADTPLSDGQSFELPDLWVNGAWPQAGGYPNHSMNNLSINSAELKKIWSADIGSGSSNEIPLTAQPIIQGNIAYTLDTSSRLNAFETSRGKKLWSLDVSKDNEDDDVISGGISYAHNTIFITNGYDEVLAVSPESKEILWRKRLPAPSRAAPTVIGGRVFVSTIDSRLVTFGAADGKNLWEYVGIGEMAGLLGAASPAADNTIVVPVFSSGEITALRVENGSVAWSDNLANVSRLGGGLESLSDIKAMPVINKGLVLAISYSGKMVTIDQTTGARVWQRDIAGSQMPWVSGNLVFVLATNNELVALSLIDGRIFWVKQLPKFEDEKDRDDPIRWNGPVMANGNLLLAGSNGQMIEVNAHNGEIIRTIKTKANVQIAPVIANGTLYLLSDDGTLSAYQ
ncbi:MAG: PQQ-binding-like beta-propeller repeat protein [Alphaproteobacteria bacterium]